MWIDIRSCLYKALQECICIYDDKWCYHVDWAGHPHSLTSITCWWKAILLQNRHIYTCSTLEENPEHNKQQETKSTVANLSREAERRSDQINANLFKGFIAFHFVLQVWIHMQRPVYCVIFFSLSMIMPESILSASADFHRTTRHKPNKISACKTPLWEPV